jgi:hypothetical protein
MSTKDRDRLKVLHEVKGGHLTQRGGAEHLGGERCQGNGVRYLSSSGTMR